MKYTTHTHTYIYIYVLDFPQKVCTALGYSLSGIEPTIASITIEHTNKALEIHGVQCATIWWEQCSVDIECWADGAGVTHGWRHRVNWGRRMHFCTEYPYAGYSPYWISFNWISSTEFSLKSFCTSLQYRNHNSATLLYCQTVQNGQFDWLAFAAE